MSEYSNMRLLVSRLTRIGESLTATVPGQLAKGQYCKGRNQHG